MATFNIKVEGLQATINSIKKREKDTVKKIEEHLDNFGLMTVNGAVRRVPVDEGHLKNSITYDRKGLTVQVVVAADYAAYVEFGTKKFAAAYVSSLPSDWQQYAATFKGKGGGSMDDFIIRIMEWVKRKGFAAEKTKSGNNSKSKSSIDAQENAAYVIALRILQNGVHAHPFLFPAFEEARRELVKNMINDFK